MKKPATILTSLGLISAVAVAQFAPPRSSLHSPDAADQKVQDLTRAGLLTKAQGQALMRSRAAAESRSAESNSVMSDQAKKNAPAHLGAQAAPSSPPNGDAATAKPAVQAPPPPPPPPPLPKWRLEGTTMGGHGAPSAVFAIDGWGEVLIHPGEKLNPRTKVVAVQRKQVILLTDGKKLERISPW